ncbi:MAG: response regulator [Mariprofundaceae bacterium]|nr:response regulator [Mariprofundaceae bacterium]
MILIVDTDDIFLSTVREYLAKQGHSSISTMHPERALGILAVRPEINLLICEQILPGFSGIELILRATQHHPGIRSILMSSAGNIEAVPANVHCLVKPFSFDSLGILLKLSLGVHNQPDQVQPPMAENPTHLSALALLHCFTDSLIH